VRRFEMTKDLKQRMNAIKALAKTRDANEIPYFKRIALNRSEDPRVRLQAVLAIGGLDWRAVSPLIDISKETEGKVGRTAFGILHALYKKRYKSEWSEEITIKLREAICSFAVMTESRMA